MRSQRLPPVLLLSVGCALVGCSSSGGAPSNEGAPEAGTPEADGAAEASPGYPAFAPPAPQVVGGSVRIAAPRVVPVFVGSRPNQATLVDLIQKYVKSKEWSASLGEYGIGAGTAGAPIVTASFPPTPVAPAQLNAWLVSQLDGTHPEWGPTDDATLASSVFVIYPPSSVDVTDVFKDHLCSDAFPQTSSAPVVDGFHYYADATGGGHPGVLVPYALVSSCTPPNATQDDLMTAITAHEIAEACTDPFEDKKSGLWTPDAAHRDWLYAFAGGEIGDMCEMGPSTYFTPPDVGHQIPRLWSNGAASAGHDPCQPALAGAGAYFNSVPDSPDAFVDPGLGAPKMSGVTMTASATRTIAVRLFSDGPTPDWTVSVSPLSSDVDPSTMKLDRSSGHDGDVLHLTLGPFSMAAPGSVIPFVVTSQLGATQNVWIDEVLITP